MKYTSMRLRPSRLAQAGLSCAGKGVFAGHSSGCFFLDKYDSYAVVGRALRKCEQWGSNLADLGSEAALVCWLLGVVGDVAKGPQGCPEWATKALMY